MKEFLQDNLADLLKATGLVGLFTGLTVAQVDTAIRWTVGALTIIWFCIRIYKSLFAKEKPEGD